MLLCFCSYIILPSFLSAQGVSINTDGSDPDASAALDISSTSKGVLLPRLTAVQKSAISSPATGLMIYQTDGTDGYYFYDGSSWNLVGSDAVPSSSLLLSETYPNSNLENAGYTIAGKTSLAVAPFLGTAEAWSGISGTNAPSIRRKHAGFWTGTEMIIWGGYADGSTYLATGKRYNPSSNTWTTMANATDQRSEFSAVWTGTEMIIWGGGIMYVGYVNSGYRYSPSSNSWTAMSTSGAPEGRSQAAAVWTGEHMLIWGGYYSYGALNTGNKYDPATDSWSTITTSGAPAAISDPLAIWTGEKMMVWGNGGGGLYDPVLNSWTSISSTNAPSGSAGSITLTWGDSTAFVFGESGGKEYNPTTNTWTDLSSTNIPVDRDDHVALWIGGKLYIWGGYYSDIGSPTYYNSGGIYNPMDDTWTTMTTTGAPTARMRASAVWTGEHMIIWGGSGAGSTYLNTGARYTPGGFGSPTSTDYYLYQKD